MSDVDFSQTNEHHLQVERKVLHLMLSSRNVVEEMVNDAFTKDFFDDEHKPLVQQIFTEFLTSNSKRLLTRSAYQQHILNQNKQKELIHMLKVYDLCFIGTDAEPDDLGYLKKQLVEGYVGRNARKYLQQFRTDAQKSGWLYAGRNLIDNMQGVLVSTDRNDTIFASLSDLKDDFIKQLEYESKHPESVIRCGIPEIDSAINVGFRAGHLTLIVADVGGHKTNLMLNIAINVSERGFPVLFVPLEMPWRDLVGRLVANRASINGTLIAHPETMSHEDWEKVQKCRTWENNNFHVLEGGERLSLARLRREIEKRITVFQPKLIVIDYADIIQTDARYESKTIEIGEMLHTLRTNGRKFGFHTLSAAQMNRSAIRALREGNDDALDSTSIHGSHNFGAVSDTIFGLQKIKGQSDRIKVIKIKCRHGPQGEPAELRVDAGKFLISSTDSMQTLVMGDTEFESEVNCPPEMIAKALDEPKGDLEFQHCDLDDL